MDRKDGGVLDIPVRLAWLLYENLKATPLPLLLLLLVTTVLSSFALIYLVLFLIAPVPREPHPSEKHYITSTPAGTATPPKALPCWYDAWLLARQKSKKTGNISGKAVASTEDAEVTMSVVIPAYNEEARLEIMLEEAIEYLDAEYGRPGLNVLKEKTNGKTTSKDANGNGNGVQKRGGKAVDSSSGVGGGYEIILIDDGSKDKTVDVALRVSKKHQLHDIMRIVQLRENRGKGGAVTHGFRHVRGEYAIFVDADGASKFSDLGKLVQGCKDIQDVRGRAIAVGSRAHMVGSEAVVKRSAFRNALMHSFHLLLRLLTPPATSRIRDTQCGFKLFSRESLPHIVPYMHAEGWIFDVEMLMLAESAPSANGVGRGSGIQVAEVPIGWHEIEGSKMNVLWDSFGMAWGLAMLRACWMLGVYRRK